MHVSYLLAWLQGLGLEYAFRLVKRGCSSIVLTSRTGMLDSEVLQEIAISGNVVYVLQGDFATEEVPVLIMRWAHETLQSVQNYIYAAGKSSFALLHDITDSDFNDVCGPKVNIPCVGSKCFDNDLKHCFGVNTDQFGISGHNAFDP